MPSTRATDGGSGRGAAPDGRRPAGRRRSLRALLVAVAAGSAIAAVAALSGFHLGLRAIDPAGPNDVSELPGDAVVGIRTFTAPTTGITIDEDLEYGARPDGTLLTLDVCAPAGSAAVRPAVLAIHGGSWARGDKASDDWRLVCEWLASQGFVAASVNYRLVPDVTYPAAIDDVALAVSWLREPEQVAAYGIDPARVGAFGGSAGGNLAALLGTVGDGPLDTGSRVGAVVELSGPITLDAVSLGADQATPWLHGIVSDYLGCERASECPQADLASPTTHVDASDPPVLIAHADDEIIPLAQADRFARTLEEAGVPVEFVVVAGEEHSIGILDAGLRERVATFLHAHLGWAEQLPVEQLAAPEADAAAAPATDAPQATDSPAEG
ncbi:alpha/beta hydrolase [Agromyces sp. SYSU T00194]|uniref:alpha/beta hydrolase n=1 Tax=Agromyces chitinivorans TaxID=3158560 RepID=UPI003396969C